MVESKRSRKSDNYNKYMLQIYIVSLEEHARKICKNNNSHCL